MQIERRTKDPHPDINRFRDIVREDLAIHPRRDPIIEPGDVKEAHVFFELVEERVPVDPTDPFNYEELMRNTPDRNLRSD